MRKCFKEVDKVTQTPVTLKQFDGMSSTRADKFYTAAAVNFKDNVTTYMQELKEAKREHQIEHYVDVLLKVFDEDINANKTKYCVVNIPFLLVYMLQTGNVEQSDKVSALRKQVSDALFYRVKYLLGVQGSIKAETLPIGKTLYENLRRKNGANKVENYGTTKLLDLLTSLCLSIMGDQSEHPEIKRNRDNEIGGYNKYLTEAIIDMFSTSVITKLLLKGTFNDAIYRGIVSLHKADYVKIHLLAAVPVRDYVTLLVSILNDMGTVYRSIYRKRAKELPLAALIALAKKTMAYSKIEALEEAVFFGNSLIWDI